MRQREVLKCLFDIVEACDALREFSAGKTLEDYLADRLLRSAVERQFMIVGEALRQALQRDPSLAESVTATRRIISFRNRLVHGYSLTDPAIVWGVLEKDVSVLRCEVLAILEEGARPAPGEHQGQ